MANLKDILVVTTPSVDGIKIKQYLKPISAHIVAGTNLSSDFFASFSDVFGGRSQTYQKQLTSLYNEAIERIKFAAYEIGANCILGLSIDMDEISGKGKSMFMLTAIGTAVIIEKETSVNNSVIQATEKFENVSVDRINILRKKKEIIEKAETKNLRLDEETWSFITANQINEIFPYILKKYSESFVYKESSPESSNEFYNLLVSYIDALPEDTKTELLYNTISTEENDYLALKLCEVLNELNLSDLNKSFELLRNDKFNVQKRGLRILTYDKPFYNRQDISDYQIISEFIKKTFIERGTLSTKKQLLSKEKEVWTCECGNTNNEIGAYCKMCDKDIYGFKANDIKTSEADNYIQQKIELITEYIK